MFTGLAAATAATWLWALGALHGGGAAALGLAGVAYSLGLRHAVDADHIAAIDNVTRRLMRKGERPLAAGLLFSLGHSAVVVAGAVAIAGAALALRAAPGGARALGEGAATALSAVFLLGIGAANAAAMRAAWRARGEAAGAPGGLLARLTGPVLGRVERTWQMLPVGVLFGLGFDTATEVGVLALAAAAAERGLHWGTILVFPALFAAGMALVDAADGWLMVGAYGWALAKPERRRRYNLTVTGLSAAAALGVGGLELAALARAVQPGSGAARAALAAVNQHAEAVGAAMVAAMGLVWLAAALRQRRPPPPGRSGAGAAGAAAAAEEGGIER